MSEDKRLDIPAPGSPNFEARIRETLQVYMGLRGDPLDRGLTVRDMIKLGLVQTAGDDGGTHSGASGCVAWPGWRAM